MTEIRRKKTLAFWAHKLWSAWFSLDTTAGRSFRAIMLAALLLVVGVLFLIGKSQIPSQGLSVQTPLGEAMVLILKVAGISTIVVPAGIVMLEIYRKLAKESAIRKFKPIERICFSCRRSGHGPDAIYCKYCGQILTHI
jgi:hypothetical protein